MKIGESGNVSPELVGFYCAVLLCDLWEHLADEMSTSSSAFLLKTSADLLGMSAPDILSSQSYGRLALSQSIHVTRVAKGIPAALPQLLQITEMITENIYLWKALPKKNKHYCQKSPDAPADGEGNFLPFRLAS